MWPLPAQVRAARKWGTERLLHLLLSCLVLPRARASEVWGWEGLRDCPPHCAPSSRPPETARAHGSHGAARASFLDSSMPQPALEALKEGGQPCTPPLSQLPKAPPALDAGRVATRHHLHCPEGRQL